jgi:hypothetical protein
MSPPLIDQVRALVDDAIAVAGATSRVELEGVRARLDEPLRVAIAGRVKAGKSTLLNALVGEELAPTDAGECTKVVTWYQDGVTYRVTLEPRSGAARPAPFRREDGALEIDLGDTPADEVARLVVEWPSARLRDATLIDTPGLASLSADVSERTRDLLAVDGDGPADADAVVYLMRHLHTDDASFLESFHDDVGRASAINAIGVISRADEVGVGRLDSMESARRIAERYRHEPTVRRLCQTVVPVAGLLAQAAATLTEQEYRALARLAAEPPVDTDRILLTADRFTDAEAPSGLAPEERARLVTRLGLFGVRVSVALLRDGSVRSARELAGALEARSGIHGLREALASQFAARRDVLKARSALVAIEHAARAGDAAHRDRLLAEVERIEAGAHQFSEIRLLEALRAGELALRDGESEDATRLLGGAGASIAERAGLAPDAGDEDVRAALVGALDRWQQRAESPLSARDVTTASRVLVRSCEGMLADLSARAPLQAGS